MVFKGIQDLKVTKGTRGGRETRGTLVSRGFKDIEGFKARRGTKGMMVARAIKAFPGQQAQICGSRTYRLMSLLT